MINKFLTWLFSNATDFQKWNVLSSIRYHSTIRLSAIENECIMQWITQVTSSFSNWMNFYEIQGCLHFLSEMINLVDNLNFSAFCSSLIITIVPFHRIRNRNFPKVSEHLLPRTRARSQKVPTGLSTLHVNLSVAGSVNYKRDSWKFRSLWKWWEGMTSFASSLNTEWKALPINTCFA